MKFNKKCSKCGNMGIEIWHFHEADHNGIQAIIYHNTQIKEDIFGNEHKHFYNPCFLTEYEYQEIMK